LRISVIIAAAGSGSRLGGDKPKQFQMLGDRPILTHTLEMFNRHEIIDDIYVAVPEGYVDHMKELTFQYGFSKVKKILPGGKNRAESIYSALKLLHGAEIVLIHDGARPFVTEEIIKTVAEAAAEYGAAVAGIPLTDTIKETEATNQVISTPDRNRFWQVQTPQGFTYELIMKAYAQGGLDQVTDDSALVERIGANVKMVQGHTSNFKVTTKEDLILGEILLRRHE